MKTPIPFPRTLLLPLGPMHADGPGKSGTGAIITPKPQTKILPAPASRPDAAPAPDGAPSPASCPS